jgi:hypothetical protein
MAFADSVVISCFARSGGRCECRRHHPEHGGRGRCRVRFSPSEGWVAYRVIRNAPETVKNCQLLCQSCFELASAGLRPLSVLVAQRSLAGTHVGAGQSREAGR